MNRLLRKRHLQIWYVLSALLLIGIISAWFAVPTPVKSHLLQPLATQTLPILLKTIDKINYTVNIRSNADTTALQLEWKNKKPLTFPSALIYKVKDGQKIEDGEIIGRIDVRGNYNFPLKTDLSSGFHFILYDIIHRQIIDRVNF